MAFQVPESKRSIRQNQFEFQFPKEKKIYRVPKAEFLPPHIIVDMPDEANQQEAAAFILRELFPDLDVFRKFEDGKQLEAWFAAWQEASGITLGESEASQD